MYILFSHTLLEGGWGPKILYWDRPLNFRSNLNLGQKDSICQKGLDTLYTSTVYSHISSYIIKTMGIYSIVKFSIFPKSQISKPILNNNIFPLNRGWNRAHTVITYFQTSFIAFVLCYYSEVKLLRFIFIIKWPFREGKKRLVENSTKGLRYKQHSPFLSILSRDTRCSHGVLA